MDDSKNYFLLKKNIVNFNGQEFKKGELLYKTRHIKGLAGTSAYVDPRNSLRRLYCADREVTRVFNRDDIDLILNIARGFVPADRYDQFTEVVEKRVG